MPGTVERISKFKWPETAGEVNADLKRSFVLDAETLRRAILDAVWRVAENGVTRECIGYAAIPESSLAVELQAVLGIAAKAVTTRKFATGVFTADVTGRAKFAAEFVTAAKFALRSIPLEKLAGAVGAYRIPVGATAWYAAETAPVGWLACDSGERLIADFPALAAHLGTRYGTASNGPLWFKLPDQRGDFSRGWSSSATADPDRATRTASAVGGASGNHVGSRQAAALKQHTHPIKVTTYKAQGGGTIQDGFPLTSPTNVTWTTQAMPVSETRPINQAFLKIIKT